MLCFTFSLRFCCIHIVSVAARLRRPLVLAIVMSCDAACSAQILRFDSEAQMAASRGAGFMGMMEPYFELPVSRESILEDALDKVTHTGSCDD